MFVRNTIVSQNVMALFESSKHPLSANIIIQQLNERHLSPNKATIYRILTKLKKATSSPNSQPKTELHFLN